MTRLIMSIKTASLCKRLMCYTSVIAILTVLIICLGYESNMVVAIVSMVSGYYYWLEQSVSSAVEERHRYLHDCLKAAADNIFHHKADYGLYFHDIEKGFYKLIVSWRMLPINGACDDRVQFNIYFRVVSVKKDHINIIKDLSWWEYCISISRFGKDVNYRYGTATEYFNIPTHSTKRYKFPISINIGDYNAILLSLKIIENSNKCQIKKIYNNRNFLDIYRKTGDRETFERNLNITTSYPAVVKPDDWVTPHKF